MYLGSGLHAEEPWFTDPLIALSGQAIPLGQGSFQVFGYYSAGDSLYDVNWQQIHTSTFTTAQLAPQLSYGLTDKIDIEYDLLYMNNQTLKKSHSNLGDTDIILGYQVLRQSQHHTMPDLRLTIEETFPTGHFDKLNPAGFGTDGTGSGSFQTSIGLNSEYLAQLSEHHYLKTHACLTYTYTNTVDLKGLSVYGGSLLTKGHINPGNILSIDLAAELSLTQHWVAVMEGLFVYQQATSFHGRFGDENLTPTERDELKKILKQFVPRKYNVSGEHGNFLGSGNLDEFSLAPAIEYNFSEHLGVIGGSWFTVAGKNTPAYVSTVISLVVSW